jgi:regulator of protease activity HflC (stomatin/prohibitin superfamily)
MWRYIRFSIGTTLVAMFLLACSLFSAIGGGVTVGPDEAAVVMDDTSGELEIYLPGSSFSYDGDTQTVSFYNLALQEYTLEDTDADGANAVAARTLDGQSIWLSVTVLYRIDPVQLRTVHIRWRDRYPADFVRPTMRGIVRDVAATYAAEQIYGEDRITMEDAMQDEISDAFAAEGFIVQDFLLREVRYTEEYAAQLEATAIFQLTEEAQTPTAP